MPRGGRRAGAGRPKGATKVKAVAVQSEAPAVEEPLAYLLRVMRDPAVEDRRRDWAASTAAAYIHGKAVAGGKKDAQQDAAEAAAAGKFSRSAPPLRIVNNR